MADSHEILAVLIRLENPDDPVDRFVAMGPGDIFVQAASEPDGFYLEAGDPALAGRAALDDAQLDRLAEIGFQEDSVGRYVGAASSTEQAADALTRALLEVYGLPDLSDVRLELIGDEDDQPVADPAELLEPGDGWYERLHHVPGVDGAQVPPVGELPSWEEGLSARPRSGGSGLWWPVLGGEPDSSTSASPAHQWYFKQDYDSPVRQRVDRLLTALHLPGTADDYQLILMLARAQLNSRAAREEGEWTVETNDLLAELATQVLLGNPALLEGDDRDDQAVRALIVLHHRNGHSGRALELARAAIAAGIDGIDTEPLERGLSGGGDGPKPPSSPAMVAFDRPDGKVRWGVSGNAADYVARHELGEYVSRNLPAGSRFRVAVPITDTDYLDGVRDELKWDHELAQRAAEAAETGAGGDATSTDPRDRLVAMFAARDLKRAPGLAHEVADMRRRRKPPARRNPVPKLKAVDGSVSIDVVHAFKKPFGLAFHISGVTWLVGYEGIVRLTDVSETREFPLPQELSGFRPMHLVASADGERCAVLGWDAGFILSRDDAPSFIRPDGNITAHTATTAAVFVATSDDRIAAFSWTGEQLFTRDGLSHVAEMVATDAGLLYRLRMGDAGVLDALTGEPGPRLRVRDVLAVGARNSRLLACNGSKQFDVQSHESVELPEGFYGQAVHDGADEFRGWADRETLVLVGDEHDDLRLVRHQRTLSGASGRANVALGDTLLLSFGREPGEHHHGIDFTSIVTGNPEHEVSVPKRTDVKCAWHMGGDTFRVVAGAGVHELQPR